LAEIQQTSDVTYRVYDFDRKDKDGNLRELHTSLAVDAIDYERKNDFKVDYPKGKDETNTMVDCPYFKTNFLELTQPLKLDVSQRDSFTIYMCVGGEAQITNDWGTASIQKGETVLVAASSSTIEIDTGNAKLLEVTI
jgi:mannose-6-phosphate isomerase